MQIFWSLVKSLGCLTVNIGDWLYWTGKRGQQRAKMKRKK